MRRRDSWRRFRVTRNLGGAGAAALLALSAAAVPARAAFSPEHRAPEADEENAPVLLIVSGVGGTPEHRERFAGWARELCEAVVAAPGAFRVRVLIERLPDQAAQGDPCAPTGRSTAEIIEREIAAAGTSGAPGPGLVLVLIGHGSGGQSPRFQIPGPDLAPERLRELLAGAAAEPVTVAHLGSASGAFLPALSAPGRVVLTATRANETNETRFAGHFIAAFAGSDADANKDGRLSALEAFDFARAGVEREYEQEGLLRSEHALLDDNGDGAGSLEPEMSPGSDGVLAARRALLLLSADAVAEVGDAGPELRRLIAERDALATRVDALREVRESMDEDAYFAELEELLVRIADVSERINALRETPS